MNIRTIVWTALAAVLGLTGFLTPALSGTPVMPAVSVSEPLAFDLPADALPDSEALTTARVYFQ